MRPGAPPSASASVARFVLPVSGMTVALLHPTGLDDLLLIERGTEEGAVALALARRLAWAEDGHEIEWTKLAPTDLDFLVLRLRQVIIGDRITSDLHCRADGCGSRVDISFSIEDYLAHHHPKSPERRGRWRVLACVDEPGWFELAPTSQDAGDAGARFRLPTVADQMHALAHADPAMVLERSCIRPDRLGANLRRRVEVAMSAMAPALAGEVGGQCPDCGATVTARFDPRRYCLRELRDRARYIYEDVDLLACRYHWTEESILAMPNTRRAGYVELARAGGSA